MKTRALSSALPLFADLAPHAPRAEFLPIRAAGLQSATLHIRLDAVLLNICEGLSERSNGTRLIRRIPATLGKRYRHFGGLR
jgi:hypothetical protein